MRFPSGRVGLRAASLLVICLGAGCLATPRPASSVVPVVYRTSRFAADEAADKLPANYWKHTGPAGATTILSPGRRVVVTEFDVEFVDLQLQSGFGPQAAFKLPPLVLGPFTPLMGLGFGLQLSGLGPKNARLSAEQQEGLTAALLTRFEKQLASRGLVVVSQAALAGSESFAALKTKPVVKSSPLLLLNMAGSDTGFVLHSRTIAAPGLGVVTCRTAQRREAETQILRNTDADIALAAQLRVGVFRGKAALEAGSTIRVATAGGQTTFTAQRSILSDLDVIAGSKFRPIVGRIEPVVADDFAHELGAMLPTFLDLAFGDPPRLSGNEAEMCRLPAVDGDASESVPLGQTMATK